MVKAMKGRQSWVWIRGETVRWGFDGDTVVGLGSRDEARLLVGSWPLWRYAERAPMEKTEWPAQRVTKREDDVGWLKVMVKR